MLPAGYEAELAATVRREGCVLLGSCCCRGLRRLEPAEGRKLVGIEGKGARSSRAVEVALYTTWHGAYVQQRRQQISCCPTGPHEAYYDCFEEETGPENRREGTRRDVSSFVMRGRRNTSAGRQTPGG